MIQQIWELKNKINLTKISGGGGEPDLYLTFEFLEDGLFGYEIRKSEWWLDDYFELYYSRGDYWLEFISDINVKQGDLVFVKGFIPPCMIDCGNTTMFRFTSTCSYNVSGNLAASLFKDKLVTYTKQDMLDIVKKDGMFLLEQEGISWEEFLLMMSPNNFEITTGESLWNLLIVQLCYGQELTPLLKIAWTCMALLINSGSVIGNITALSHPVNGTFMDSKIKSAKDLIIGEGISLNWLLEGSTIEYSPTFNAPIEDVFYGAHNLKEIYYYYLGEVETNLGRVIRVNQPITIYTLKDSKVTLTNIPDNVTHIVLDKPI